MAVIPAYGVEKHSKAAVRKAFDAIIDRATKAPEQFMNGMLDHPHLAGNVRNLDEVVRILLEKGQEKKLNELALHPKLPDYAKKVLINALVFA